MRTATAASNGIGVALIPRLLVEDELARGTLVQVGRYEHPTGNAYFLIYPEAKAEGSALAAFREWLSGEAQRYSEGIAQLVQARGAAGRRPAH
ncbi:LysR substrate-binding domain-containing protein [Burkholderia cenocepacia]|uniref:LysR substrate-binding domain-containing protein n=1 Tax=Burkholderia cenocepacia TaxID=95486 RepID=UPI00396B260B